jgi:large subunit ribosomal protein L30
VADKTHKTIRIKWIRSGIGFDYRQRQAVRSLGLGRLNQIVERPDTPQIRGLVAKIQHLVTIVRGESKTKLSSLPEYTVFPPQVEPAEAQKVQAEPVSMENEVHAGGEPVAASAEASTTAISEKEERKAAKVASTEKAEKPHRAATKKTKGAKPADAKAKKAAKGEKHAPRKPAKPAKGGKK